MTKFLTEVFRDRFVLFGNNGASGQVSGTLLAKENGTCKDGTYSY